MPQFYDYNGQKYSLCFPLEWATNQLEGTGPTECNTCNIYGCDNGIFKLYCCRCNDQYYQLYHTHRVTGEYCISANISNSRDDAHSCVEYYTDEGEGEGEGEDVPNETFAEEDAGYISDISYEYEGISNNRTAVEVPIVSIDLPYFEPIVGDDENTYMTNDPVNISVINNRSICFDLSNTFDLESTDVSCIDMEFDIESEPVDMNDISISAVMPVFDVAVYNAEDDISAEINRFVEENPIHDQGDHYEDEDGVEYGLHQSNMGYDGGFDMAAGYNSY